MLHAFWTDFRYAARLFLRSPGFVPPQRHLRRRSTRSRDAVRRGHAAARDRGRRVLDSGAPRSARRAVGRAARL